jgi:transaldolase
MERQAKEIASWGDNVIVKIPITNTKSESSFNLIERLVAADVEINVTAIMTLGQVIEVVPALRNCKMSYVSVFAGRIADTGRDPVPVMQETVQYLKEYPNIKLIWASPREILNVIQAEEIGCDVITVTFDLLKKLSLYKKDLTEFSLETVKMFYDDALAAGYSL